MAKKQILKKSKMKVNQAEGKLIFYFFILVLQFTAIRWSTTRHHFWKSISRTTLQYTSMLKPFLSFLIGGYFILLPSSYSWRCRQSCPVMWGHHDFLILSWTTGSWRQPLATLTWVHKDTPLWKSGWVYPFHCYQAVRDPAHKELSTGVRRLLTTFPGRFLRMLSSKCLITLHL